MFFSAHRQMAANSQLRITLWHDAYTAEKNKRAAKREVEGMQRRGACIYRAWLKGGPQVA